MLDYIKLGIGIIVGVAFAVLFYELPVIGRVALYSGAQVKIATSGMVSQARLDESNALLLKSQHDATFNAQAIQAAAIQTNAAKLETEKSRSELNARIEQDSKVVDDAGRVTQSDIDWGMRN